MKRWKWITLSVVGAAQLIQPDRTLAEKDPADDLIAIARPSATVVGILRSACYDCHSNETRHPWYAYITPVSWWIQKSHVEHARHHFNFSAWGTYSMEDRGEIAEEAMELVSEGEMPLASYTWLHGEARINQDQRQALVGFFSSLNDRPLGGSPEGP